MVNLIELVPMGVYLTIALAISFLCSLLEAVILSVNHPYIEVLTQERPKAGNRLKNLKENTDRSLAAILTLNTFAHTIGAAGVGAEVQRVFGDYWLTFASIILTLFILVFSEIIPKSVGAAKWKRLAPVSGTIIHYLIKLLFPLVWLLEHISKRIQPDGFQGEVTREEMIAAAELGEDQGALEADETRVIKNLLQLDNILAEDVMTPSTVMLTFEKDQTVEEVLKEHTPIRFSRIPVIKEDLDDVIGVVLRSELLDAISNNNEHKRMAEMVHPLHTVSPEDSVGTLFDRFIERRDHIFLVVDEYGSTQGLVTLEDAIETLLGVEIVDESDSVDDMRELARQQWDQRRKSRARGLKAPPKASPPDPIP